jgi:hypothetical protein
MASMRLGVIGLIAAATSLAHADDTKTADEKFDAAQKLREAGKVKEACAMFQESLTLNPNAIGTILNVARCAEEDHKFATAVRLFTDVRDRAKEQGLTPQREAAEEHLTKLVGRVGHLGIAFVEPATAETRVVINDSVVDPKTYGDVAVDPGEVRVVVSAPGRVPFDTKLTVAEGEHKPLAVQKLGLPVTVRNTRRTYGKAAVIIGGATFVAGGVLALYSWHRFDQIVHSKTNNVPNCDQMGNSWTCNTEQFADAQSQKDRESIATVIIISGVAIAAGGAALWFLSPNREVENPEKLSVVPVVGPGQAGVVAFRRF